MSTTKKPIKLPQSNGIVNESLEQISESPFENVYQQADRTIEKIIINNEKHKDELCLNVLAFLGGRGRGKTSAMSSFLSYLNKLQKENEWSELSKRGNIQFLTLPYIDAAMLADAEYIIDVILAQMWDEFEKYVKDRRNEHNARFEKSERDIKQQFIQVRKSYLILKEREEGHMVSKEMDVPVPSALHELAASINLRDEIQKLIENYLEIFRYNSSKDKCDNYLIIAIDDVDMSGKKAHFILEQIRRYLSMQKVIVLITADIDRLQLACESRYTQIYKDDTNRRKFINEYLEKVLPYNMRIYLPEIKERHDAIEIQTQEKFDLKCKDEKNMILESMARYCGIYFDGCRRKRHFLQNQSMRSLANYFEQMIRMKDDYLAWLKIDLKERIVERIMNKEQKDFMDQLIAEDYEDVNGYVITYISRCFEEIFYEPYTGNTKEKSMGQVLYLCRLYEERDARNTDFVNAIILLYSIILGYTKEELKENVIGDSLWGELEYGLISREGESSAFCLSFDLLGSLDFSMNGTSGGMLQNTEPKALFEDLVYGHKDVIIAWLCSLLFFSIDVKDEIEYEISVNKTEVIIKSPKTDSNRIAENSGTEDDVTRILADNPTVPYNWKIALRPMANARKSYLTNAFRSSREMYNQLDKMLSGALKKLADWVDRNTNVKFSEKTKEIQDKKREVLREINRIIDFQREDAGLMFNVEIIYSIAKELSKQVKTYEFDEREAYKMLVSSYKIIQEELRKRDKYFKEEVELDSEPGFEKEFMNSPQAQVLLQTKNIPASLRKKIREKLGGLLIEYRSRTTVLQKTVPSVKTENFWSKSL